MPWSVVYTGPGLERAAEHRVRQEGFAGWLPLENRRLPDRSWAIRPIFSRYMFVQSYPWLRVMRPGEVQLGVVLTDPAHRPLLVPGEVMAGLFAQCAPNGVIYPPEPREVRRKDKVTIEEGPLKGFSGICQRTSRDRIWVLLATLGETVVRRGQVELAA